jgi:predicted MPP superfamily phosphohydrolase
LKFKHNFDNIKDYNVSRIYSAVDDNVFNVTISHLPQLWHELCDNGYSDLTLSGHIHSMQFKYNLFGYKLSPAAFLYDEWSGLYEREKGKLYINDGIGTVGFFARLGARPEVTLIILKNNKALINQ